MQKHPTIELIQQSDYLPEIPNEFGETLSMLLEPCEFDMEACIEKLLSLPKLESTLIQALNYKSRLNREILTLKDAVLYLGAINTRLIAISHITRLLLPNSKGRSRVFDNKKYWKHCLGTSIASYMIADETGICDKEKIFTYGLIHDIGITVLDICLPDQLDNIFTMQMERGIHQIVAEKIVLGGITHTEIGMWICEKWGLPREITEIVGYHHSPFVQDVSNSDEVMVMHIADSISTNYYENLLGTSKTFIYADKTRKTLNIKKELIENITLRLPDEVDSISRFGMFDI